MGLPPLRSARALILALAVTTAGCAVSAPATDVPATAAPSRADTRGLGWSSAYDVDHPMVGMIYEVGSATELSFRSLLRRLSAVPVVLLGEQHPNLDHHRLQARILGALVATGRRPVVAFEQFDVEDQDAIDAVLASGSADGASAHERATALATAVAWSESGWPPFDGYRPVVEAVLEPDLPIRAANLSRDKMRALFAPGAAHGQPDGQGDGADGTSSAGSTSSVEELVLLLGARESLVAEIRESHCGYAGDAMIEAMVAAQQKRDQTMAAVVRDALAVEQDPDDGLVLIAGFGHTRLDYGVPRYLKKNLSDLGVVSVALVEVLPGRTTPAAYAEAFHASELPFDFVVFTPRSDDEDPCEKYRAALEKMRMHSHSSSPRAEKD